MEKTEYQPGTLSWVDLGSPDPKASAAFYGAVFGWQATEPGPIEETGGYQMFTLDGKNIGGLMPLMQEGQPPAWSSYISVEDADKIAELVQSNGGTVLAPPMDVMDFGRMAIFADPTGGVLGVWQPRTHIGAGLFGDANQLCWTELNTRDTAKAKEFYTSVFGWGTHTSDMGAGSYTEWKVGDTSIGGMMDMPEMVPAEVPAYWLPYFTVDDPDATVQTAKSKGGTILAEPMDIEPGRFAVIADPHGAAFAIINGTPQQ